MKSTCPSVRARSSPSKSVSEVLSGTFELPRESLHLDQLSYPLLHGPGEIGEDQGSVHVLLVLFDHGVALEREVAFEGFEGDNEAVGRALRLAHELSLHVVNLGNPELTIAPSAAAARRRPRDPDRDRTRIADARRGGR